MDKKIRITSNGHDVSFTSKALTIDDKEYLYKNISDIKHSSAKHLYIFRCDGEWHKLEYDEKDQKKVSTIFSRIAALKKAQKPAAKAEEPKAEEPKADEPEVEEPKAEEPAAEEATVEEPAAEEATAEEPKAEETEEASEAEEKAEEEKTAEEAELPFEVDVNPAEETERKGRLKKSITILLIIIALFVVAGIAYFFVFGTPNDSSQSPATDSTHQYNDIDELIDEMQE